VNWAAVSTNYLGSDGTALFRDAAPAGQTQRFYRLALP
jgi:hypothetical protein